MRVWLYVFKFARDGWMTFFHSSLGYICLTVLNGSVLPSSPVTTFTFSLCLPRPWGHITSMLVKASFLLSGWKLRLEMVIESNCVVNCHHQFEKNQFRHSPLFIPVLCSWVVCHVYAGTCQAFLSIWVLCHWISSFLLFSINTLPSGLLCHKLNSYHNRLGIA